MVCEEFALYFISIKQILYKIIRNQLKQPNKSALLLVTAPLIHLQTLFPSFLLDEKVLLT